MAFCQHCDAAYCKDCGREWKDCKLAHNLWYTSPYMTITNYDDRPVAISHTHD